MNSVILEGSVASEPQNLGKLAKVRVATPFEGRSGQTGNDYHTIVGFGRDVDTISNLSQGDSVRVEGRLNTQSFEKRDGTKGTETRVIVSSITVTTGVA